MVLDTSLIKAFVAITDDSKVTDESSKIALYGTIIGMREDNKLLVTIDGSGITTVATATADCHVGDRVTVSIEDHKAIVNGNITEPASAGFNQDHLQSVATDEQGNPLMYIDIRTGHVVFRDVDIAELTAARAAITDLYAVKATVTDLNATNANVQNLQANKADIVDLNVTNANVQNLQANKANITDLEAAKARITTLEATQITTEYLHANYAEINLANIVDGSIKTAMIDTGAVGTAQIADGSITDAKIVSLTANKITAGRIDASAIDVVNLNAANITVGSINGQQIAQGAIDTNNIATSAVTTAKISDDAITADKIVAEAITSAKIASNAITSNKIAANAVTADKMSVVNLSTINANCGAITAGTLASIDYVDDESHFSETGMKIDLNYATIKSPYFSYDSNGAYFKGYVEAETGQIGDIFIDSDRLRAGLLGTGDGDDGVWGETREVDINYNWLTFENPIEMADTYGIDHKDGTIEDWYWERTSEARLFIRPDRIVMQRYRKVVTDEDAGEKHLWTEPGIAETSHMLTMESPGDITMLSCFINNDGDIEETAPDTVISVNRTIKDANDLYDRPLYVTKASFKVPTFTTTFANNAIGIRINQMAAEDDYQDHIVMGNGNLIGTYCKGHTVIGGMNSNGLIFEEHPVNYYNDTITLTNVRLAGYAITNTVGFDLYLGRPLSSKTPYFTSFKCEVIKDSVREMSTVDGGTSVGTSVTLIDGCWLKVLLGPFSSNVSKNGPVGVYIRSATLAC